MGRRKTVDEEEEDAPAGTRRCLVTGERCPRESMIRFVLDPDGQVTPDLAETLPGRGMWLSAQAGTIKTACDRRLFAKAAKARAEFSADLPERVIALLVRRTVDLLSLARRAGDAVAGFDKVQAGLRAGRVALLLEASDGAEDGRRKLVAIAGPDVVVIDSLSASEIGAAFGRDRMVHAVVAPGGLGDKLRRETLRLSGLRSGSDRLS